MKSPRPDPVSAAKSAAMRSQRTRGTEPELRLRRTLHGRGLRYRLQVPIAPGSRRTIDIAFPRQQVAVLVHGCFWHRCPEHGTQPKSNGPWWTEKLDDNVKRDRETIQALVSAGWIPLVVWEHERVEDAADRIERLVAERRENHQLAVEQ